MTKIRFAFISRFNKSLTYNAKERGKIKLMYKYYAFYVKIHVSGVAPCVNPSENSSRTLMESTFDEVGSLAKLH